MVPATVALYTASSSLFFMVWILGGIISLFGALSVAELGAAMPKAGGQYVYLNEAYGPVWGYLYGWSAVAVINTASIAAVGVAFAEYLRFFFPLSGLEIKSIAIIFIIILTTINVVDLARSMLPNCEIEDVGIRPGEKLHEVMVPLDDARNTIEFDDYYVIEPDFQFWDRTGFKKASGGRAVADNFEYNSGTNPWILTAQALGEMLKASRNPV